MVTNRVDKIMVTSGSAGSTVAGLTAGQYIAIDEAGDVVTALAAGDKFQIVLRKQDGTLKYSDIIDTDDIRSVQVEAAAPVVEQEVTVALDTPVAGQEYLLTIVDKSDKEVLQRRQDKRTYQVIAEVGETETTLGDKFEAAVNADANAPVTATNAAGTITLEAKAKVVTQNDAGQFGLQHYFEAAVSVVDGLLPYASAGTVTTTVEPDFGSGTFAQVREMEADSAGYEGYLNRTKFPVKQYPYDSVASATYNLVVVEYDNNYWSNSVVAGKVDSPVTLVLASSGATTSIETLFAAFI